ncbi:MAG: Bcep22 gp19 [Devosia sp.]|uniref:hypothetical protein n=1 Tax=Devosia sp. TaxID=1871048 RepID=UPI002615838E|nr:hypothetical protein [Devosia sp.]MDB5531568.1 Bcep22 gp19 [Devosia sp.]
MTDAAIIQATYSEWKMVKTRKVLVLSFEVPLEAQAAVQAALGTPMPDAETWVAIARLRPEATVAEIATVEPPAIEHQPEPPLRKPAKLAQLAGIMCNEGAFLRFSGSKNADEAANWLRGHCNVVSRADLDTNEDAAITFRRIKAEYDFWMRGEEQAA